MAQERIPVGVIGVGHLGSLHTKMLSRIPGVELIGVVDLKPDQAAKVAAEYHTAAVPSVAELLGRVRAVSIATPTQTHAAIARQAVEAGIHCFIEKPVTSTVPDAEDLTRLAAAKNVIIQVGHVERFNPALLALEHFNLDPMFIESHRLAPFNPRGTDVAVVLDLMIHDIDIIMSLVHSPVERIDANGVAVVSETADIANARIRFANGCVANITASRISQKKMRKMRLFQRDAYISIDFSDGVAEVFRLLDENAPAGEATMMLGAIDSGSRRRTIVYERPEKKDVNALEHELTLFADAVRNGTRPIVSIEDGLRALKVAEEIVDTIRKQKLSF
jgi:predicted dehydrogenase